MEFPIRQKVEIDIAGQCIACGPNRAAVSSPIHDLVIRTMGTGARLNVAVMAPALNRQLAALLGEPPSPLELAPAVDLTVGYGRSLSSRYAWP